MVGGGLHEGRWLSYIYSFIFERGWLKGNSVVRHGGGGQGGGGLHERELLNLMLTSFFYQFQVY